jgi:hypothetical protein
VLRTALGGIYGFASDNDGGAVPGAAVTLATNNGSPMRQTVTNPVGRFHFSDLPPGTYEVTFVLQGFKSTTTRGIRVSGGTWAQASAMLALAPLPYDIHSGMERWGMQPGDAAIRVETPAGEVMLVIPRTGLEQLTCLDHGVWASGSLALEELTEFSQPSAGFRLVPGPVHKPNATVRGMAIVLGDEPRVVALMDKEIVHTIGRVVQGKDVLERLRADVTAGRLPALVPIKSISRVAFI